MTPRVPSVTIRCEESPTVAPPAHTTINVTGPNMPIRFDRPTSLAIEVLFNGPQPNLFGATQASSTPMQVGAFKGDTRAGGSCNVAELQMNPHCNGTHTETIGHLVNEPVRVSETVTGHLLQAALVSVRTRPLDGSEESYDASAQLEDQVITARELATAIDFVNAAGRAALVVRSLPNTASKQSAHYDESNLPPYFTYEAAELVSRLGFTHWLVDVPSIDRIHDGGRLLNHHIYWNVPDGTHELHEQSHTERTVSEMLYIPDHVVDGLYVLNLQVPAFALDVAPSRPIVYPEEN